MKESDRGSRLNDPKLNNNNSNSVELNNNINYNRNKDNIKMFASNESLLSGASSATSSDVLSRRSSEEFGSRGDFFNLSGYSKSTRSKSCSRLLDFSPNAEHVEIFPSVPDELLEEMGLIGDQMKRTQSDDELEQKFATLSLAFSIDSNTIKNRCERQRRYRDQTEKNLAVELERLTEKVNCLTKICVDMETTELLATLLAQIDIVFNASTLASSSAERFGAVQHEERLTEAVKLMIDHVNSLKQQRDLSRKQLQYTKRVLQDTDSKGNSNLIRDRRAANQQTQLGNPLTKRRASIAIATIQDARKNSEKTFVRRPSELSFRTTAVPKFSRPSRMDLGVDLVKIKEGMMVEDHSCDDFEVNDLKENDTTGCDDSEDEIEICEDRDRITSDHFTNVLLKKIEIHYNKCYEEGYLSHAFYLISVMLFCFAIIILMDVLFELEFSNR